MLRQLVESRNILSARIYTLITSMNLAMLTSANVAVKYIIYTLRYTITTLAFFMSS
jgi:hypothetical protein